MCISRSTFHVTQLALFIQPIIMQVTLLTLVPVFVNVINKAVDVDEIS